MVVQAALEPEEVFQHVESRVPLVLVIHQLYPALDDRDLFFQHHCVDHIEDVRVDVVLRIEDGHHLVVRMAQAYIQAMGLINGYVLESDHMHVGHPPAAQLRNLLLGLGDRPGVVDRADHHHL